MSAVNTIGASSTLTEKKLEASIAAQTDVSPQTSVEAHIPHPSIEITRKLSMNGFKVS